MAVLPRHAVIVVHGVGEQVPFSTVRSFVGRRTASVDDTGSAPTQMSGVAAATDRVFSEPSPVATRSDDRAYTVTWNHSAQVADLTTWAEGRSPQERVAITDFFEFYWAPRYRLTRPAQLTTWLFSVLRRPRSDLRSERLVGRSGLVRLMPGVMLLMAVAVGAVGRWQDWHRAVPLAVGAALVVSALLVGARLGLITLARVTIAAMGLGALACAITIGIGDFKSLVLTVAASSVLVSLLGFVIGRVVRTLGDAARYLSFQPDSVEETDLIRQQLLELLEGLHDARDLDTDRYRYDRIVLVGHSLGSVIAYDGIRLLWNRKYRKLVLPEAIRNERERNEAPQRDPRTAAILALEEAGLQLTAQRSEEAREAFQRAQEDVQLILRDPTDAGARWIITDFITLGSPLTYADAFMATSMKDLRDRFEERSLAACPPERQLVRRAASRHPYRLWIAGSGSKPPTTRWHQAAPFACVKWQNLWFEHDLVGGPVREHFGYGVEDQSLGGRGGLPAFLFAYPHSSYWKYSSRPRTREGSLTSIQLLRETISRKPTLLLTARTVRSTEQLASIAEILSRRDGKVGELVDVRLYVGADDRGRIGCYLPVARAHVPGRAERQQLRALLGRDCRITLLSSPDVLAEPSETRAYIDSGADLIQAETPESDVAEDLSAHHPHGQHEPEPEPEDDECEQDGREVADTVGEEE